MLIRSSTTPRMILRTTDHPFQHWGIGLHSGPVVTQADSGHLGHLQPPTSSKPLREKVGS